MNASTPPLSRLPAAPRGPDSRELASGMLHGVARHVTADGCQFAMAGAAPEPGCHLSCRLSADAAVTGLVRWTVQDRIGFAFDQRLDASSLAELATSMAQVKAIPLEIVGEPADPR